jgi:hypothetical protein
MEGIGKFKYIYYYILLRTMKNSQKEAKPSRPEASNRKPRKSASRFRPFGSIMTQGAHRLIAAVRDTSFVDDTELEFDVRDIVTKDERLTFKQQIKVVDAVMRRKHEILPGRQNLRDIISEEAERVLKGN